MVKKQLTAKSYGKMKKKGEKIVWLTAYDYYTAKVVDNAGVDGILVGDSMAMVVYGHKNTLAIDMDTMVRHTEAVSRAVTNAMVVGDMPFGSYQTSDADAIGNAARFLKEGGAAGVKIEGGVEMAPRIKRVVECGIPVMGHIGLTPQSVNRFGGYRVQGKTETAKSYLLESAQALQEAGCFSIVLEAMKSDIAEKITKEMKLPTIGIGAGNKTDGQIIVINDILGLNDEILPKFVRRYSDMMIKIADAASRYSDDVRSGNYPSEEESYG